MFDPDGGEGQCGELDHGSAGDSSRHLHPSQRCPEFQNLCLIWMICIFLESLIEHPLRVSACINILKFEFKVVSKIGRLYWLMMVRSCSWRRYVCI